MIYRKKRAQRVELAFAQGHEMIRNEIAEMDFAIFFDIERAVVLGQAFIEPDRHIPGRVINQLMNVLVINHAEWILARFSRKRDVVYVFAFLKIAGIVSGVERLVRAHTLKDDHGRRNGSVEFCGAE